MKTIIKITSLGSSGEGVGSIEGLKVFVEGALPGEEVEITLLEKKKNYALGQLETIVVPSSERRTPACPLFGKCGGCQLMHLTDQGQLEAKRQKVEEALKRIGGFKGLTVPPCIPSPSSLYYRNKIQLPLLWNQKEKTIGLFKKNSHEIIPVEKCLIQDALGEKVFSQLQHQLEHPSIRYLIVRTTAASQEALVIFVTDGSDLKGLKQLAEKILKTIPAVRGVVENINRRDDNVILGPHFRLLAGQNHIEEIVGGKKFRFSAASFFQVNPLQAENLYKTAIDWADLNPTHQVLDAFCGIGALALFAADKVHSAIGIECVPHAIEDAKYNAKINSISNCTFYTGRAEEVLTTLPPSDVVFLNPPRKGCEASLLSYLVLGTKPPSTLIYISCDPATLARDLKILASFGYTIDKMQPFDMFPQTTHVETLVKLIYRKKMYSEGLQVS